MSDTPESAPKRETYEPAPDADQVAPATAPAASAAAEPQDGDHQVAEPPSDPVSARGHINRPAGEAGAEHAPAYAAPAAPAEPARPAAIAEPEPVVASEDDVAAAVARSGAQPSATAAGDATLDTASPVESATPVIAAAEAANLRQSGQAPTVAYAPAPAGEATAAPAAGPGASVPGPQPVTPIYLQRPEPPKKKSNRGVGILIALVGTLAFAVLWAAAVLIVGSLLTPSDEFLPALIQFFTGGLRGWVPVVAFFIGMVVLIQLLNRARWWAYILGGLFVAVFVYFVYIGASLIDAEYWKRNSNEFVILLRSAWVNPFAVLAGLIAREISVWTGAWLAGRGRRLKARNAEAQADYEQQVADAQNQAAAAYAQQGTYAQQGY
ncbi:MULTISPECIES: hypothetical protein [unclassified Leifsonia]|uniref:hypothetical protein n=1 Tax=unclassified Leifsonia TaxID=2663824 RepID=UPI0008A7A1F6|nr:MULTISPECIES: hypothetical protein [unclassified Leifsonia]SEH68257.1 hypothetical protein SAMN04515694_102165 [Leifsonia sp. CL154]SFL29733.1 hypothetical protein SAMN04515692_102166 [Leifsonia sp. CL147]